MTRARHLIEPLGGRIVAEFFDIDKSRSIPPQRRPQAGALLYALADPHRGFDAVVIGEPQRAFYGNQFGNTFPLFTHYGIPLWAPEVGGPIDPDNEAHELIMSVFGGLSKGERNRIRLRVRTAMAAQAQLEGRFLGGRPPYGYLLVDAGRHPNPAKAAEGKRLHALALDESAAPIVQRIFADCIAGVGLDAIARQLTAEGIPCPSAHDRQRNPHRSGLAWATSAVRAILLNPRYTGRQVWNRQRKDEVLLDVTDVALGHTTKQRWNEADKWIYSDQLAHDAIVDDATFQEVQQLLTVKTANVRTRRPRPSSRPYALRGLLFCGLCGRRMQGSWNNNMIYYRCVGRVRATGIDQSTHSRGVFLQERAVTPKLDAWLAEAVEAARLPAALNHMIAALRNPDATDRARLYAQFGLHITYDPGPKSILIRAEPRRASINHAAMYKAAVAEGVLHIARLMNPARGLALVSAEKFGMLTKDEEMKAQLRRAIRKRCARCLKAASPPSSISHTSDRIAGFSRPPLK
jgi:site-specific DNA recombinase